MKEAKALLEKYKAGTCTPEEMQLIDKWLLEIHMGVRSDLSLADFEQISSEIWETVIATRTTEVKKVTKLWPRIAALSSVWKVAAAVAAITLGVWLYFSPSSRTEGRDLYANDIVPGKNTATLTLANGETINLSDAKTGVIIDASAIKYSDGSKIDDSSLRGRTEASRGNLPGRGPSTIKTLAVTTPRGGTYQVTLPDGTKVWLNADSKISFPSQFIGKERKILLLNGEAYFEVYKDKSHPFIVESEGQRVEVLGTHFNINSYADETNTKTTLLEGSVRVSSLLTSPSLRGRTEAQGGPSLREGTTKQPRGPSTTQLVTLKPGQQASLKGDDLQVKAIDAAEAIDWKNGEFVFKGEEIKSIMNRVAKWYDIEVVYNGPLPTEGFNGIVSRNKNISQVLKMLEQTNAVHFRIEGKRVYVSK